MLEFMRIACAVPKVAVGNVWGNLEGILDQSRKAAAQGADLVVFPELSLTGYTCQDLFFQQDLQRAVVEALKKLVEESKNLHPTLVVGLPLAVLGQLYNCAAVVQGGRLHGLVPKTFLPNYNEFYERRWFSSSEDLLCDTVTIPGLGQIPIGRNLIFDLPGVRLGVEQCEDLWTPLPPSTLLTLAGAEVIVNLSASDETIGKRGYRRDLVKHQSAACCCVYAYTSAGRTESTQDLIFSGHALISENGRVLAEHPKAMDTDFFIIADADLGRVRADRSKNKSFRDSARIYGVAQPGRYIPVDAPAPTSDGTLYPLEKLPFVPSTRKGRFERCMEIFSMQVSGLMRRLEITNAKAVIGISGGLDSTLAVLVAAEAMRRLGRPLTDVWGVTMPCYGTSDRTYNNSLTLMQTLGISTKEVSIRQAVDIHFKDIGHDPTVFDGTYENSQARERTQVLMDYASVVGGIVIGTGDLSELALGWCTYNGDHMSMYGVNGSIPKTLIRWMIEAISESPEFAASKEVLTDILDTPISPELLPPDAEGKISQQTEDIVGPYALHDFFLYYVLRFGFGPEKIFALAKRAFAGDFDEATIYKWLSAFYRRFLSQQFKRSCMPDGVKVGSVCFSPRGDWRMPSDVSNKLWMQELEKIQP